MPIRVSYHPLRHIADFNKLVVSISKRFIVSLGDICSISANNDFTFFDQISSFTEFLHGRDVMTHKQYGPSFLGNIPHLAQTLLLKGSIPYSQHFVYYQNIWLEMCRYSKSEPNVH